MFHKYTWHTLADERAAASDAGSRVTVGRAQANWINIVAEQQQRDPARLAPLKPLPDVIQVRTPQVLAPLPLPPLPPLPPLLPLLSRDA